MAGRRRETSPHKAPRSQCTSEVDLQKWAPALASHTHLFLSRCGSFCGSWEMAVSVRQLGSEQRALCLERSISFGEQLLGRFCGTRRGVAGGG